MNKRLSRMANMRFEEYKSTLLPAQSTGPRCAICATEPKGRKLARDHCHKSGIRRGDLCARCNMGIGLFGDDIELMFNAIKYLRHYRQ